MRSSPPAFLLFSGHNDRAVISLCRYLHARSLPYLLVSAGPQDAIRRTVYEAHVAASRLSRVVDLALFEQLAGLGHGASLVYTPTTEFMNLFVLEHRAAIESFGWRVGLPPRELYLALTSKLDSQQLMDGVAGLRLPETLRDGTWCAPCVLKPRANVRHGAVLYPQLCDSEAALAEALRRVQREDYFAQAYVTGQSYYLCAYLARDGRRAWFWQENLLQQGNGKSIVLARSCAAPGVDADTVLDHVAALGYHGPFMMELIVERGRPYFIEINPRFWGPLQLAVDACPALLDLFAEDHGFRAAALPGPATIGRLYAWCRGGREAGVKAYPALATALSATPDADALLIENDIYRAPDTAALHQRH